MVKDLHNFFSQIFAFLDFSKKKRFQNSGFDARRLKKSPDRIEEAENNSTKKFIFKERKEKIQSLKNDTKRFQSFLV
jgi:hypothetical protein